jgi:pimeloyl-ACP methyl ester carboxylesterase
MTDVVFVRPDVGLRGTVVGEGPVVLLLHAGGERRTVWEPVAGVLAAAGFCAATYDQRGHGDTAVVRAEALPAFAEDVAAVVRSFPEPMTIVGSSLGGLAALLALSDRSLRASVASLVLVDVVPELAAERVRGYLEDTTEALATSPLVSDILSRSEDLCRSAQALEMPTLLVRAEFGYLNDSDVRSLRDLVPHATVSTVLGAGHLVARDAPQGLAEMLLAHLAQVPRPKVGKYSRLPEATSIADTIAEHDHRIVPDPEGGRDTDLDFQLRNS